MVLLMAMCGCAHQPPDPIPDTYKSLDEWQVQASRQVRGWVPLGTPNTNARHTMEQHGFTTWTNSLDFLGCYYQSSGSWKNLVEECINVNFHLTDGKVLTERVTTGLKGP